mmetsp:Transcript_8792/g.13568  ORF Transcript_8792/g.13568 Transcript_8792/m.13568 type:complete len:118 (+) Transcript_8792:373-726(+)
MKGLGATVKVCPNVPSKDMENDVNQAYTLAKKDETGVLFDQFENPANFLAHFDGTGPEIWEQAGQKVDAFVAAAGTGGTLAGISSFLKSKDKDVKVYLADPQSSNLFDYICKDAASA